MPRPIYTALRTSVRAFAVSVALAGPGLTDAASPPDYSARALHLLPDGTQTEGRVVKSGPDMRLEYTENGRAVVQIIRRAEGVMYMLDPGTKSYFEVRGTPSADPTGAGYMPPCPEGDPTLACAFKGNEVSSGITAELWEISIPGQPGTTAILWDGARHRALRQTNPDGSTMTMSFVAMENIGGRDVEHWQIAFQAAGQPPQTGEWFYDPQLRVEVREVMPGGESRTLEDVAVGPVDPSNFEVPAGWQRMEMPQPQAPVPPQGGN